MKTKLGDITQIITGPFGSQLHMSDYVSQGYPVIMPQNIVNRCVDERDIARINEVNFKRLNRYAVQPNDIIFARRGKVEEHAFIDTPQKMLCGTGCFRVRVTSKEVNPLYLSLYLSRPTTKKWLISHAIGSNMPNLNTDILSNVSLELPEYAVQVRIAQCLQSIDDKIKCNNEINDNLQQELCLIYEHIMSQAKKGLILGTHAIASELSEITTGREDANFADTNGKYKFFTCSSETLKCNHYAFNSSSILIAGNGEFNVKHFSGKFNAYQRTYVLTPKQEHYGLLYLACLYQIKSFKSSSAGSIVKFITKGDIDNIPVFIPDDGTYLIQMNKLLDLQEMRLQENEKLLALRDFLLPLLMNGQATIAE